jgi:SpoVK/Ycf46/Vps4 family AAA+-type ATPase
MSTELVNYIKAGYPCLFLRTIEPHLAEKAVREAVQSIPQLERATFGVWKVTTGLMENDIHDMDEPRSPKHDLLDALDYVKKKDAKKPIIAVFHNVRQFMDNFLIIQQLIDTIMQARLSGSHILLVGPDLETPAELRHMITFVDMPLPTKDELSTLFNSIVTSYADEIDLPSTREGIKELCDKAAVAAMGLDSLSAESSISLAMSSKRCIDIPTIQRQKADEVRKSDVLEFIHNEDTIDELGGFDEFKKWLIKRKSAFSQEATDFGLPSPKGVLLVGNAGTGKSHAGKICANVLGLPLLRLDVGKLMQSLVGQSEATTRIALKTAEAVAPVVLLFDEVEKMFSGMNNSGNLDSGVTSRVISTILTWRQETKASVFIVMSANEVKSLPSMVYRKGRIDAVWSVDLPVEHEREEIFSIHIRKRGRNPENFDLKALASESKDFTGAEIEGCVIDAMYSAFYVNKDIDTLSILQAIRETIPQSVRDKEETEAVREWAKTRAMPVSSGKNANEKKSVKGGNVRKLKIT